MTDQPTRASYDVVIVGGGAAGLSAALMLSRSRRSVLVVDGGAPRNAPAAHMHGFLTRDGTPPGELLDLGRREILGYGGEIVTGEVVSATRDDADGAFTVELRDAAPVRARRLLAATGLVDELPDVAGLAERWGRDVVHCPYCHGWEIRDQRIGVLSTGPMTMHQTLLFRQWTDRLTLLTHTGPRPGEEDIAKLAARDIAVVEGRVEAVEVSDDGLSGVRLADGNRVELDALAVASRAVPRAGILAALGVKPVPHPSGLGEHVAADPTGRTDVPGVWVAGNVADLAANVIAATASGAMVGAQLNADLVVEDTELAVHSHA